MRSFRILLAAPLPIALHNYHEIVYRMQIKFEIHFSITSKLLKNSVQYICMNGAEVQWPQRLSFNYCSKFVIEFLAALNFHTISLLFL